MPHPRIPPFQGGKRHPSGDVRGRDPGPRRPRRFHNLRMTRPFDDELPRPLRQPTPSGWFEVACCATILIVFAAGLVALALFR